MVGLIRPRTCSGCAFHEKANGEMTCHRNAPSVSPILSADRAGRPMVVGNVTLFPQVTPEMWCGEFKPRIEQTHDLGSMPIVAGAQ